MLIQTAERAHAREIALADRTAWWPYNALDIWARICMRNRRMAAEAVALHLLDGWRNYATHQLAGHLFAPAMRAFLQQTGGETRALLLDRLTVSFLLALSTKEKLRFGYTGAAYEVRRASDNAVADIGYAGSTPNLGATIGHCTSSDGLLRTWYDETGNARHLQQTTDAAQPKLYDGATTSLLTLGNGVPAMLFDGVDDYLLRGDACGLTGSPALTAAIALKWGGATTANTTPFAFGASSPSGSAFFLFSSNVNALVPAVSFNGRHRAFDAAEILTNASYLVASKAASGLAGATVLRQNGAALAENTTFNPTSGQSLINTATRIGSWLSGTLFANVHVSFFGIAASQLAGNDLTILEQHLAAHSA